MGNVSKKGENMEGIITWSMFTSWFFNQTLSIYIGGQICSTATAITIVQNMGVDSGSVSSFLKFKFSRFLEAVLQ